MIENATSAAANHAHTGAFDSMIGPPAASNRNRRATAIAGSLVYFPDRRFNGE
jgi:hypothetical protein